MPAQDHACRVCGLLYDEPTWGADGCTPLFEICPCCGVEFGYEDCTPASTERYRKKWISEGCAWFRPDDRPADWDLSNQLKNVPPAFR